ncbi:hypothetical protein [Methanomethylophilus alvi]|uniref:hypothetical protein n=1 Tax=Methanomethylophilus alvi TaxID=1291540 RepID=UPI0037DD3DF3
MKQLDINNIEIVTTTDYSKKLTIDGVTESYPVYRIKLECLYYNDQNDRIATWLSKFKSDHPDFGVDSPDYNDEIHKMIVDSNPDAFKKTKKNIELYNQREPGVILMDGRVIDGNRRFTCLRELSREDDKFGFFEAVILPHSYDNENGKKIIKALELAIQHGTDKQVDYDPINKLVGIYRDLIEDGHAFTIKEYARYIDQKESEVQKSVDIANLMIDYLDFLNAPKQFYIAVEHNINGPLYEMQSVLKKITDEEQKEEMKKAMFSAILFLSGDITREVRKYRSIADSGITEEFFGKQRDIVDKVTDKIIEINGPVTPKSLGEQVTNDKVLMDEIQDSLDDEYGRVTSAKVRSTPIKLVEQAISKIDAIDKVSLQVADYKNELRKKLEDLEQKAGKLRALLDE